MVLYNKDIDTQIAGAFLDFWEAKSESIRNQRLTASAPKQKQDNFLQKLESVAGSGLFSIEELETLVVKYVQYTPEQLEALSALQTEYSLILSHYTLSKPIQFMVKDGQEHIERAVEWTFVHAVLVSRGLKLTPGEQVNDISVASNLWRNYFGDDRISNIPYKQCISCGVEGLEYPMPRRNQKFLYCSSRCEAEWKAFAANVRTGFHDIDTKKVKTTYRDMFRRLLDKKYEQNLEIPYRVQTYSRYESQNATLNLLQTIRSY